jgi:hypothetical protein
LISGKPNLAPDTATLNVRHGELEPTSQRDTLNDGKRRERQRVEFRKRTLAGAGGFVVIAFPPVKHLSDICAGAKGLAARPDKQQRPRRVGSRLPDQRADAFDHGRVERIHRLRPV